MLKNLTEKTRRFGSVVVLAIGLGLFGCSGEQKATNPVPESPATTQTQASPVANLPKVVATTGVICDITRSPEKTPTPIKPSRKTARRLKRQI
jgi:manganese/iron transport system substrate-binding protein